MRQNLYVFLMLFIILSGCKSHRDASPNESREAFPGQTAPESFPSRGQD